MFDFIVVIVIGGKIHIFEARVSSLLSAKEQAMEILKITEDNDFIYRILPKNLLPKIQEINPDYVPQSKAKEE